MSLTTLAFFQFLLGCLVGFATIAMLIMGFAGTGASPALLLLGIVGMAFAMCILIVSASLQRRQNYIFCISIAACECLIIPFGTILGLFTIQTLWHPEIKLQFGPSTGTPDQDRG